MRIFKNKLFLGILCILAGLLAGFVILPAVQEKSTETVPAIVLKQSVQAGTQITSAMLESRNLPKDVFPNAIKDTMAAIGKYAAANLYAGDCLTAAKLTTTLESGSALTAAAKKGKLVVSVTLPNLAAGVSGRLLPGDIVTVLATPKNSEDKQSLGLSPDDTEQANGTIVVPELRYLEVCMVTAADAADSKVSSNPSSDEKNTLPVTVSFYATQAQALELVNLEQTARIHIAFVARGADAATYIPDADRVLVGTEGK